MAISALNTALSSLLTHQRAIEVLSENVANAENPDYTRKIANFEPVLAGQQGGGVQISSITRVINEFLLQEKRTADGDAAVLTVISSYLQEIVSLYGTASESTSLAGRTNDLAAKLQNFSENATDTAAAADVVASAELLTASLRRAESQFQDLRTRSDQEIAEGVNRINTLLREIDIFNVDILRARAIGERLGAHNNLLDRRDVAINALTSLIETQVSRQSDGTVILTTVGGRLLLDIDPRLVQHEAGNELQPSLRYDPDAVRPTGTDSYVDGIFVGPERIARNDVTRLLSTGRLKGLIELRDQILPNLGAQLDEFARVLRDEVNRLHNEGAGWPPTSQYLGNSFLHATVPDPTNAPNRVVVNPVNATTASNIAANFTGIVRFSVVRRDSSDRNGEVVSTATLDFDDGVYASGSGNRSNANLAQIIDAVQGLQGDDGVNLSNYVEVDFDANGRLSVRALDPLNHGIIIQQPENLIRSVQVATAASTQADVRNAVVSTMSGTFEILAAETNRSLAVIDVSATTTFQQLLDQLNELDTIGAVIVGQQDVTSAAPAATTAPRYYLEITENSGQRLMIRDVVSSGSTVTVAQTLGLTGTDATVTTGLRRESGTRYSLSRGFSSLTAPLQRLDQRRTIGEVVPATNATFSISFDVALASSPGTTQTITLGQGNLSNLANVVTAINTQLNSAGGVNGQTVVASLVNQDGWRIAVQSLHDSNEELVFTGDGARYFGLDSSRRPTESRGLSHFMGLNDFFQVNGEFSTASHIDVTESIKADPTRVSIRRPYNDPVSGGGYGLAVGNSEIGAEIYELFTRDQLFFRSVGNPRERFYIGNTQGRLQDFAEGIVSSVSTGIRSVRDTEDFVQRRADEVQKRVQSVSGVNLEEELLQLEQYTYAYNAARRVLETVANLYDQLLEIRF